MIQIGAPKSETNLPPIRAVLLVMRAHPIMWYLKYCSVVGDDGTERRWKQNDDKTSVTILAQILFGCFVAVWDCFRYFLFLLGCVASCCAVLCRVVLSSCLVSCRDVVVVITYLSLPL